MNKAENVNKIKKFLVLSNKDSLTLNKIACIIEKMKCIDLKQIDGLIHNLEDKEEI